MTKVTSRADSAAGRKLLQRIADDWAIDPGAAHWVDDGPSDYSGFSWWPGDFCVRAHANLHTAKTDAPVRLRIDTDFIRGIDLSSGAITLLLASTAHLYTSGYAWVYVPPELEKAFSDGWPEEFDPSLLWLSTTAYIRDETAEWLPQFVGRMAILQPISAQIQAGGLAGVLHAEPNASSNPSNPQAPLDEILNVLGEVIAPIGKEPSRWDGSEEFAAIAETWGRSDSCFGTGDPTSLTLETPFGADSALIRLLTDQAHPQLGNGLLATLQLPVIAEDLDVARLANELNYLEASSWTGFPLIGCWHSQKVGGGTRPAFSTFVPNVLHQPGIATNVALWMLNRARWVRAERYPDLVDQPMIEILNRRMT
jgi:hypothetical protein